jgi:hypothetical protein
MELGLFVRNQSIEYRQNALAVLVNAIQIGSERPLEILGPDPFVDDDSRHVDVLAQGIEGVSAQEETVEEGRLTLGRQRVEIVSWSHSVQDSVREKDILAMVSVKDQVL